ncbi:hypothetical protein NQ315_009198 [Exocentrus adspersus]|uniref:von Hippel-Lindau disease tumour suppressor beta domain-containing protein n=1 Tax=Exocentrus adspersus TaxID=1586481 RepID=A0AAV8WG81_9CUCU|nr:hypothetical protein NQ315_009198 [Exocentrus adspersus]
MLVLPRSHSLRSEDKAYVRFINKTDRMVELIWLNFNGKYVRYQILEKDHFVDVNTYKTHPWIALDVKTKDRLHIEKAFIYHPKTSKEYLQEKYPDQEIPENYEARIRASITLPLYSLKYRSLIEVRDYFRNAEDVDQLDLPKSLAEDLKRIIEHRNLLANKIVSVRH